PEYAVKIINTLGRNRLDPKAVAALTKIFERGDLRMHRSAVIREAPAIDSLPLPTPEVPKTEAAVTGD
ncbi:MAG TPA: hypothetical protein VG897_16980, partial [Terriglobales bacterium]|nr:hypothetical protein [Terriglobales bacterium]